MASNWIVTSQDQSDSEDEGEIYSGSSDDDEEYQPNESEEFEQDSEESDDDDTVAPTQEEREQAILEPNSWLLSKDKTIQYSRDDCPVDTRRNATPTIHKGKCSVCFRLLLFN